MYGRTGRTVLLATVLGLLAPAAALGQSSEEEKATPLTDANIAAIVVGANTIDIEYAKIARERATNEAVRAFAETMIDDHTSVNDQASALARRLNLTPVDNETSRKLAADAEAMREKLRGLSGAAFDRAYIENEVAFHRTVLEAIDGALVPNAENEELKALIVKVRPAIEAHLKRAESIRSSLGGM